MLRRMSVVLVMALASACFAQEKVRSVLYPENWHPGYTDDKGQYLHDFSYAGYHKSEIPLPKIDKNVVDVTQAPYRADASGKTDATAALQQAIDEVGKTGGVVYLPAGLYKVSFQQDKDFALRVHNSNVVLRGAGLTATKIYLDDTVSAGKTVVLARPDEPAWWPQDKNAALATQDLLMPTRVIPLADVSQFAKGQFVAVRTTATEALIEEMGMAGKWKDPKKLRGITLVRRIEAVDAVKKTITLDTPTRYPMKMRDNARVYKLNDTNLREVGFEDFAVGMKQNMLEGLAEEDYTKDGTAAKQLHASCAVKLANCEDSWALRVGSFKPEENETYHIHSNGLRLTYTRQVTVADCDFRLPEYRGGGGNGYLYCVDGNDNLFRDCLAVQGRHNYDLQHMNCVGNVLYHCTARKGDLASDFHMYYSTANLLDSMVMDQDFLECVFRPWGGTPMHGESGSHNVFWNTYGAAYGKKKFIVVSRQPNMGFVIGTQGPASNVAGHTTNFVELAGKGDRLDPQSLWQDQLKRRLAQKAAQ